MYTSKFRCLENWVGSGNLAKKFELKNNTLYFIYQSGVGRSEIIFAIRSG